MAKDEEIIEELDENSNSEMGEEKIEESGIFDEDTDESELNFEEADESISDFSIGDTILSSASTMQIRQSHNLEDLAGKDKTEGSGWDSSGEVNEEEKNERDFYNNSSGNLYEGSQGEGNSYQNGNENLYSEKSDGKNAYDFEKVSIKSYDQLKDERRGSKSMLEISGFEDNEKQKHKEFTRDFVAYDADKAA